MNDVMTAIRERFPDVILDYFQPNVRRGYVTVPNAAASSLCRFLHSAYDGRLAIITGVDTRAGIELLYHIMFSRGHLMLSIRTIVTTPMPRIESLGSDYPAALWAERELTDILGVTFTGHPDPRRLIMADDWPEHIHPLRRDFTTLDAARDRFRTAEGEWQ